MDWRKLLRKEIGKNTKLEYWLQKVIEKWTRGIGVSRHEVYKSTGGTSPYVHSYSTLTRYVGVLKSFISFAKQQNATKLKHITRGLIRSFFTQQIQKGVSKTTLKVQMCALEKAFSQYNETLKFAYEIRDNFQNWHSQARDKSEVRAYEDPSRIITWLYQHHYTLSGVIAEIMTLTGARLGDIRKMEVQGQNITIHGSKGGRDRTFQLPEEISKRVEQLLARFAELTNQNWGEIRRSGTIYSELKSACSATKEIYSGFHGFRAYFAKVSFARHLSEYIREKDIYIESAKNYIPFPDSLTEKLFDSFTANYTGSVKADSDLIKDIVNSSLSDVSKELGHNRISIAMHYVKA